MSRLLPICLAVLLAAVLPFTAPALPAAAEPEPIYDAAAVSAPYWVANPKGAVWNFGSAGSFGDLSKTALNKPIVGMEPTPTNKGYWLVATDGGIFAFGDAKFFGSTGNIKLNSPIVGMVATPTNNGYWMVAADGGIFAYGDARFYGSTGNIKLNKPIVGMAPTPTNAGYWLVATDGGIFAFGDAKFFGSTGNIKLNKPIVSMAAGPGGAGYWLVASDGGIFSFGSSKFFGSSGGGTDNSYAKIVSAADGQGYWLIRNGGDATAFGSVAVSAAATTKTRPAFALLHTINSAGDLAIEWAMRQRGKPYLWGGAGPDAFDCSGLTLRAWQAGGMTIPRVANDQYDVGRRVPLAQLKAGDLVFWATDTNDPRSIYHVALYLGGGNVIMAPKTGDVVRSAAIWSTGLMPYGVHLRD